MKKHHIQYLGAALIALFFWGCPAPPPKTETDLKRPELTIQVASLDAGVFNRKLEKRHLAQLAKLLKNEQIEVLAVQNITRYPGLGTRVDFVDELTKQTDWRNVFGEMVNASGLQTGNAIFSSYPILSHHNESFEKIKSANYDAAIQATIDGGVRSLVLISAQVPAKASVADQNTCVQSLASLNPDTNNPLTILTGNLPSTESVRTSHAFAEVPFPAKTKGTLSKVWYTANPSVQVLASRSVEIELGTVMIAQLGLFRQKR